MTFEVQRQQPISMPVPAPPTSSILHIFERALRDVSLPIERAREIYNLQREIEFDLAEREYIRVRSLVEQELEPVARDASNPQTKSRYATLPQVIQAVRPIYSKHGIIIEFDTADSARGEAWIKVLAFLSHESGYKRTYHIDMPADGKGAQGRDVMTRTHATGSAVSYGRRYLLLMIFNIAVGGEDDDGNAAGKTNGNGGGLISNEQQKNLEILLDDDPNRIDRFCALQKIDGLSFMPASRYEGAVASIKDVNARRKAKENGQT